MSQPRALSSEGYPASLLESNTDAPFLDALEDSAPTYLQATAAREPTTHTYSSLPFAKGSVLSLQLRSSARSAASAPLYFSGSTIRGDVKLTVPRRFNVREVTLKLRGRATPMHENPGPQIPEYTFLKLTSKIWPPTQSDASSSRSGGSSSNVGFGSAIPEGEHTWPFTFTLPTSFTTESGTQYDFPPSCSEKVYLTYTIMLILKRDIIHSDINVLVTLRYLPRTRPTSPSQLCREALRDGLPVPGPIVDPEGWGVFQFNLAGRLMKDRDTSAFCQFAMAHPPEYTHGSIIPFYLSITSPDPQTIELLASPESWSFTLCKTTRLLPTNNPSANERGMGESEVVSTGTAWRTDTPIDLENGFIIRGEVAVPRGSMPSFVFPSVQVSYAVQVTTATPAFRPQSSRPQAFPVSVQALRSEFSVSNILAGALPSDLGPVVPRYVEPRFRGRRGMAPK